MLRQVQEGAETATQRGTALGPGELEGAFALLQPALRPDPQLSLRTGTTSSTLALLLQYLFLQLLGLRIPIVNPGTLELLDLLQELCDVVGHGDGACKEQMNYWALPLGGNIPLVPPEAADVDVRPCQASAAWMPVVSGWRRPESSSWRQYGMNDTCCVLLPALYKEAGCVRVFLPGLARSTA